MRLARHSPRQGERVIRKLGVLFILLAMTLVIVGYLGREQRGLAGPAAGPQIQGKIAYVRDYSIWMYADGKEQQLTQGPQDRHDKRDAYPSFSPDGTFLAYTRFDEGFSDLYILDMFDPTQTVPITRNRPRAETGSEGYNFEALWALYPVWSPDGTRIAFTTDQGTEYPGLFSVDPEGKNLVRLETLNHGAQTIERPSWSPDGTRIAVANYVTDNGIGQIWVRNLQAGRWLAVTNATDGAYDPAWSPDGEWIAFTMRQGRSHNIYIVPTNTQLWQGDYPTPIQITTDGASRSPAWSPDGMYLAYLSTREGVFDLYIGEVEIKPDGSPAFASVQRLTEKANIDAPSGLSWGQ